MLFWFKRIAFFCNAEQELNILLDPYLYFPLAVDQFLQRYAINLRAPALTGGQDDRPIIFWQDINMVISLESGISNYARIGAYCLNITLSLKTMKNLIFSFLTSGAVICSLGGCSSTTTETTDTTVTTETVASDMTATETETTQPAIATDTTQGATTAALSEDPTNFVLLAGSLDLLESESSKMAMTRAVNPEVKNFAQMTLSDHSSISKELRAMATAKKIKYPANMLPKHQLVLNNLTEEKAKDFDKTYMELQEATHNELEELFEDGSKRHSDPEMQAFASKYLPVMRTHLENTKRIKDIVD